MRSYRSVAMPDTCPKIQLLGSGFGQNGSTWKRGTLVSAEAILAFVTSASVALSHTIAALMVFLPDDVLRRDARSRAAAGGLSRSANRATPCLPQSSAAVDGLQRLDRHHARHRLNGARDLRRDLETSGKLHLDLGALAEHQDQRDLAVVLCGAV